MRQLAIPIAPTQRDALGRSPAVVDRDLELSLKRAMGILVEAGSAIRAARSILPEDHASSEEMRMADRQVDWLMATLQRAEPSS